MITDQHKPRQTLEFSPLTSQRDDYRPPRIPSLPVQTAIRPRLSIPFTGTPTSRDYRPFPAEALVTQSVKHQEPPHTDHISGHSIQVSIDTSANWNTTHREAYQFAPGPLEEPLRVHSTRRLVLPFTAQSTSRADFQAPPAEVICGSSPNSAALKSFCDRDDIHIPDLIDCPKFEGSSSYATEFKAYPLPDQQANLQYDSQLISPLPFEGVSECQSQFRQFRFEPAQATRADNKTFTSSISSPGSVFEGTTEFHDSFKPIPIQKNDFLLEPYPIEPQIMFEGTTESRDSYRPMSFYETSKQASLS